jgi:hypothetical protein
LAIDFGLTAKQWSRHDSCLGGIAHLKQGHASNGVTSVLLVMCLFGGHAWAGNEANFVLYDHHTDSKGETEINVFSDFSNAVSGDPSYAAQLLEIEH